MLTFLQSVSDLPWDKIAGGGAALVAFAMCYLFLKHLGEMRKEHGTTIEKVSADFAGTVRDATKNMNETTNMILRDSRDREAQLHALWRETRADKKP